MRAWSRSSTRRGSTLTEFAIVALELFVVMFAVIEFGRMALVYNNVANAARVGLRYAITHGCARSGTGQNGASGPLMGVNSVGGGCFGTNTNDPCPATPGSACNVCSVVIDYAKAGLINPNRLVCQATSGGRIQVTWPDGTNGTGTPPSHVTVTVVYPYDPFFVLPITVPLGSTAQGVITF
jgi:hypothetical protein